jgi:hypothetical protein
MKKLLIVLALGFSSSLNADEPKSLIDAINATSEAREILMKDLQDADLGSVRDEFTGCPSRKQFAKILEDEKRYNAAARRWLKEAPAQ